jgi:sulfate adenylyltransferase subunit 1
LVCKGETLLEILEAAPSADEEQNAEFRFPVQFVCRPHASADADLHDFRGFMGRIESQVRLPWVMR